MGRSKRAHATTAMTRDRSLLYAAAFARATGVGMSGVLVGLYAAGLGLTATGVGAVISAGLLGVALGTLGVTLYAERLGRARCLIALALLSAAGTAGFALAPSAWMLAPAAALGMVNGMGRDRGAAFSLEQALLPDISDERGRTRAFAWYNVVQDAGHALGGLAAAMPALLRDLAGVPDLAALRLALGVCGLASLLPAVLYLRLSAAIDAPPAETRARLSPATRSVLWKISALFALDAFGGGFVTASLLAFFFYRRFGVAEGSIGLLFFGARLANAGSHLAAAWLARRIGLVNTMVFTHVPSSLLLATVPFAPSFPVAAVLFLVREGLVEMDVPTRQSYVMAVVRPGERTLASGITNLVRLGGWAVAPSLAGLSMQEVALATPLVVGAGMKVLYDVLLYRAFRHRRPPEERLSGPAAASSEEPRGSR